MQDILANKYFIRPESSYYFYYIDSKYVELSQPQINKYFLFEYIDKIKKKDQESGIDHIGSTNKSIFNSTLSIIVTRASNSSTYISFYDQNQKYVLSMLKQHDYKNYKWLKENVLFDEDFFCNFKILSAEKVVLFDKNLKQFR